MTPVNLRGFFSRVAQSDLIAADAVATDGAIESGYLVTSSTLGGAWLAPWALTYFQAVAPGERPMSPFLTESNFLARPLRTSADHKQLVAGIRRAVLNRGVFAVFNERVFAPRVLYEVLTGENVRYPAEKLIVRNWLQSIAEDVGHAGVLRLWNHDLAPWVLDFRSHAGVFDEGHGELVSPEVRALGRVQFQDYGAWGRTNLSNAWLRFDSDVVLHRVEHSSDDLPGPLDADAPLGKLGWGLVTEQDDRAWSAAVMDARALALNASESLRRQILINRWLDRSEVPDPWSLGLSELLTVPWTSLAGVDGPGGPLGSGESPRASLAAFLAHPLSETDAAGSVTSVQPRFDDPYTWRGLGLATMWAYESRIALAMVDTLTRLTDAAGQDASVAPTRRADLEVSRFEVERYVRDEYLDELDRMREIVDVVLQRLGSDTVSEELAELTEARATLDEARENLPELVAQ